MTTHEPIPIHFRLLYNWTQGLDHDPLLHHKVSMYAAFEVVLNHIPIYRLIDATFTSTLSTMTQHQNEHHHYHHEHWISVGQLWKACGLTMIEGLFLFELASSQYQLDFLQPSFPFTDIWVPLGLARSMATILGVMDDLAWFLNEPLLGKVASSDDADRQEMVHNWRIVGITNTSYSTRALLDYVLMDGELLTMDDNNDDMPQTTTLMTRHQYQPGIVMKDRAETGLVRWQVWAYEHFLTSQRDHPSLFFDDTETYGGGGGGGSSSSSRASRRSSDSNHRRQRYKGGNDKQRLNEMRDNTNDDNDSVPAAAVWDVAQGLLCDLQSLKRQQQQQHDTNILRQDEDNLLKASRVFSDSMVIGNMPLKSTFLRQSPALQNIYLSMMMEKLYNVVDELSVTTMKQRKLDLDIFLASSAPPLPPQASQQQQQQYKEQTTTSTSTSVSATTQSEQTSKSKIQRPRSLVSKRNNHHQTTPTSQMDPNMMLHDRMDLLEQEMYRVKKRVRRKMDECDLKWMELQHQFMTLDTWKRNLESRRKNERAWMLLIILLLSLVLWVFL